MEGKQSLEFIKKRYTQAFINCSSAGTSRYRKEDTGIQESEKKDPLIEDIKSDCRKYNISVVIRSGMTLRA